MASDSIDNRAPSDQRADQSADGAADHKTIVREEFTRHAEAHAAAAPIRDPDRLRRLVEAVNPRPDARVLEVATGPGHVAMAFAAVCRDGRLYFTHRTATVIGRELSSSARHS